MLRVWVMNQAEGNKGIDTYSLRYNRQSTRSRPAESAKLRNACNVSGLLLVHRVVRYVHRPPPLLILRISLMNVPLEKVVPLITT